jgi:hypothetical protein
VKQGISANPLPSSLSSIPEISDFFIPLKNPLANQGVSFDLAIEFFLRRSFQQTLQRSVARTFFQFLASSSKVTP